MKLQPNSKKFQDILDRKLQLQRDIEEIEKEIQLLETHHLQFNSPEARARKQLWINNYWPNSTSRLTLDCDRLYSLSSNTSAARSREGILLLRQIQECLTFQNNTSAKVHFQVKKNIKKKRTKK